MNMTLRQDMIALGIPPGVVDHIIDVAENGSYQEVWDVLHLAADHMTAYGVADCSDERYFVGHYYQNIIAEYVNMGETYTPTLLFDTENQTLHVTSWGDWYEEWETKMLAFGEIKPFEE